MFTHTEQVKQLNKGVIAYECHYPGCDWYILCFTKPYQEKLDEILKKSISFLITAYIFISISIKINYS
jgi:hypothetical protein